MKLDFINIVYRKHTKVKINSVIVVLKDKFS